MTAIFLKIIEKPPNPAAGCNLFDILLLCLTDKFNSPKIESFIDIAAYPAAQFKSLVELPDPLLRFNKFLALAFASGGC